MAILTPAELRKCRRLYRRARGGAGVNLTKAELATVFQGLEDQFVGGVEQWRAEMRARAETIHPGTLAPTEETDIVLAFMSFRGEKGIGEV